ncbi:hypothetical protein [Ancylobacter oerskovii]|uniref:Uncharacterized protein n=1 Tax=Ancylobacter oerskovii TaxID=459519 RepID=A0ABW4YTQ1_9HYPH|nr:hypothetical protein [Ancylobacter oerskovii]MBS7543678.1 hypothetical protein [Ancylobacter oerskovii]
MQTHLRKTLFIAALVLLVVAVAGSMVIAVSSSRSAGPAETSPATQGG